MIFDIVEYIIKDLLGPLRPIRVDHTSLYLSGNKAHTPEWNGQCRMKAEYAGYTGGCLSLKTEEECCWPVCRSQVQVRKRNQKLNREDYGVHKYWVVFFD